MAPARPEHAPSFSVRPGSSWADYARSKWLKLPERDWNERLTEKETPSPGASQHRDGEISRVISQRRAAPLPRFLPTHRQSPPVPLLHPEPHLPQRWGRRPLWEPEGCAQLKGSSFGLDSTEGPEQVGQGHRVAGSLALCLLAPRQPSHLCTYGPSRVFSSTTAQEHQFFGAQPSFWPDSHLCKTAGKTIALTRRAFVSKVMSLLFNMLSRFLIAFLLRSKRLLISWLQSPSSVILEPKKIKSVTASSFSPSICHEVMGPDTMVLGSEC